MRAHFFFGQGLVGLVKESLMGVKIWWPLLFVGSIILACVLIFPSDPRLADLFGRAGKFDEAIEKYLTILEDHPMRTSARIQLSKLYILNEEHQKAVREIEKGGLDSIDDVFFLKQISDIYSQLGEKQKTVFTLEKIVRLDPDNHAYRRKLADAYDWNEETEKARELYQALLVHYPHQVEILNKLTHLNLKQKRFNESLPYLTKLIELGPKDTRSRILLADVYIEIDRKRQAAAEFEEVLKIEPKNEPIRRRLAELYIWLENFDRGLENYEFLVKTNPANAKYFDRYTELAYNLAPQKAIQYHRLRLEQMPDDKELRERFAGLFLHVGDTDNAIQQMHILIARNPDTSRYYKQLAYLYQDMREPHLANKMFEIIFEKELADDDIAEELIAYYGHEKEYDKLMKLYPSLFDRGRIDEQMVADYADLLFRTRHYNAAAKQYAKLLKLQPGNPEYRMQLADLHRLEGQNNQAARLLWEGVQKYDSQDETYLVYSAQFMAKQNLLQQSIACYEKLASIAPENLQYKKFLVSHYMENRDFEKAIRLHNQILAQKPGDVAVRFELASLYWLQKDFERMHAVMAEFNPTDANGSQLNKQIGQFYFERGFYTEAIECSQTGLKSSPHDSSSLRMLGLAYAWNNQPRQSQKILEKYNQLYRYDYFTHFEMGQLLIGVLKYTAAMNEFQISLDLIGIEPETKDTRVTRARIYAYQKERGKVEAEFESLIASYPNDVALLIDYAEGLVNLKAYLHAGEWLARAFELDPDNYRASRLESRSYFEQGQYKAAAHILKGLLDRYPDDTGLRIDLADSELAGGDWHRSSETLKSVLSKYPRNLPAQERLTLLRRQRNQALAADYTSTKQSKNFFRQMYNVVVTTAKSSLLHLKLIFGEEEYSTKDNSLPGIKYQNAGFNLFSNFSKNLQTEVGAKVRQSGDNWYLATSGQAEWSFDPSNTLSLSANLNAHWNDPFTAAFQKGRLNRLQSDLNLFLFKRIFLWNRFSYEQHKFNQGHFGNAFRSYVQIGRRWDFQPQLSAYYQLYHLKYSFGPQADRNLISVPEKDLVHTVGGNLEQNLAGKLYYHLGGSVGFSGVQNTVTLYGTAELEYTLLNRIRMRSLLEYGHQGQLTGNDKTTSLRFDLSYFY